MQLPKRLNNGFYLVRLMNGTVSPRAKPFIYQDLADPRLQEFRRKENLDHVVKGATTEFEKMVYLRSWAARQWIWSSGGGVFHESYSPLAILDAIRKGKVPGLVCGSFNNLFIYTVLSFGLQARPLGVNKGYQRGEWLGGHATCEVYSNEYKKWVYMDATMDFHYTREGIPLSAFEIQEAWLSGHWDRIQLVEGGNSSVPHPPKGREDYFYKRLFYFYAFDIFLRNDLISGNYPKDWRKVKTLRSRGTPPPTVEEGKKVVGYEDQFYWPLNEVVIQIRDTSSRKLKLLQRTFTPNFKHFLIKKDHQDWVRKKADRVNGPTAEVNVLWPLHQGINDFWIASQNHLLARGAVSHIRVVSDKRFLSPQFVSAFDPQAFIMGLAVNAKDEILAADRTNHRVAIFHLHKGLISSFGRSGQGRGEFICPTGIALDENGFIYVVDTGNKRIERFSPEGKYLKSFSPPHFSGDLLGIAIDPQHQRLYVSASQFPHFSKIYAFTTEGKYLFGFGKEGDRNGCFSSPVGLSVDRKGYLYVADSGNCRIEKFDRQGKMAQCWGQKGNEEGEFLYPNGLAVVEEVVYVADTFNHRIQKFTLEGEFLVAFGQRGNQPFQFQLPRAIAADQNGRIYIADTPSTDLAPQHTVVGLSNISCWDNDRQ